MPEIAHCPLIARLPMTIIEPLVLDVVSDVVCPWCFVGKRRIERAARLLDRTILIRWHPFELNPEMPRDGMSRQEYRIRKFGSLERSRALEQQLAAVGHQVGIDFRYDLMERISNTRRAHALLALALKQGLEVQNQTAERLFTGYFQRGEDPGDLTTLMNIAQEIGIVDVSDPETLNDPVLLQAIRKEEESAAAMGVSGVPSMFHNGRLIASGAQPEQILADALRDH